MVKEAPILEIKTIYVFSLWDDLVNKNIAMCKKLVRAF